MFIKQVLYLLFYTNTKKTIPENIFHLLNPIALQHWIMGDGQRRDKGLVLCKDSYSILEVVRLVNVLIIRYNFVCTIRENSPGQFRIYISEKSMTSLRKIVLPYMDQSMLYKINGLPLNKGLK
jgi:LAGLIDADG DNA endonuclease family